MTRGWTLLVCALVPALAGCGSPLPQVTDRAEGSSVPCGWHEEAALDGIRSYRDVLPNTRFRERGSDGPAAPCCGAGPAGERVRSVQAVGAPGAYRPAG